MFIYIYLSVVDTESDPLLSTSDIWRRRRLTTGDNTMSLYTPFELIEKLVGFPTVSRDSNLELIHFVQDYLQEFGIKNYLVPTKFTFPTDNIRGSATFDHSDM